MNLRLVEFPSADVFFRRAETRAPNQPRGSVHGPDVTVEANEVHGFLVVETREVSRNAPSQERKDHAL